MRRREFLAAGASLVSLRASRAQPTTAPVQPAAAPVIGFLDSAAGPAAKLPAFYDGLEVEGFIRSRNVVVLAHSAAGDATRLPALATELVNRKVTAIVADGVAAALAAKAATQTIPVVFAMAADPVRVGCAASLNRPGGNLTGVTTMAVEAERRRVEVMHELLPAATALALIVHPANADMDSQVRRAKAAARGAGVELGVHEVNAGRDLAGLFAALNAAHSGGAVVADDDLFTAAIPDLAAAASRSAVPTIYHYRDFVTAGGLLSFGSAPGETYHQLGAYAALVLKGANPAELPVYQTAKTELVLNLRAARSLQLTVPQSLLDKAEKVAE